MTTLEQTLTEIFIDIVRNNKRHLSQSIEDFNVLLTSKPEVALHNLYAF